MKTLNQVRDELAYSYESPIHRNCYGCCQSDDDYERAFRFGFNACLEHLSKGAGERKWNIQIKHGKVMSGSGVFSDCENIEVVEHQTYLSKCAQLAKTQDMVRMAIEGVYHTMVNNNLIGEEFAKKHIDHLMGAILEIGAGK